MRELFEFGDLNCGAGDGAARPAVAASIRLGARSPKHFRALVVTHRRTRYVVYEGDLDHIIGMVHVKDLLRLLTQGAPITSDEVRPIPYVPETTPLDVGAGAAARSARADGGGARRTRRHGRRHHAGRSVRGSRGRNSRRHRAAAALSRCRGIAARGRDGAHRGSGRGARHACWSTKRSTASAAW